MLLIAVNYIQFLKLRNIIKMTLCHVKMGIRSSILLKNQVKLLKTWPQSHLGYKQRILKMSTTIADDVNTQATKAWSKSSVSDIYEQTRPDYSPESVKFLLDKMGGLKQHSEEFVIVELGAGTGKFTRAMCRVLEQYSVQNVKIIATDPVAQMCEKFKTMVPGVEILQCPASNITLLDTSANAVVAAQSFHWFSTAESVREIHRVLKPKGTLGIIWNIPDRTVPWIKTVEEMLQAEYIKNNIRRPEFSNEWLVQVNSHGGFGEFHENDSHKCTTTHHKLEGVFQRYRSVSIVAAAEGKQRERMIKVIKDAVNTIEENEKDEYQIHFNVWIKWFNKL